MVDASPARVPQLDALTGSRFIAAYAILVLHGQAFGYALPAWLNLSQAVSYFFVLSGFIIGYRYPALPDRRAIAAFYWARFARVWPVHFFCLAVSVAALPMSFWSSADGVVWLILTLQILLLNAWVPIERFVFGFNPVAWTISVEWFFYLAYPLLLLRWNTTWRWKVGASASLVVALALMSYWTGIPAATTSAQRNDVSALALLYGNPLARLFEFTLGMTVAMVWHRYHARLHIGSAVATTLEIVLLCAIGADMDWAGHRAPEWAAAIGSPAFDWRVLTSTPLGTGACLLYAPLILVLATGAGWVAKALAQPLPVLLGESSYALYMIQNLMLIPVIRDPHWLGGWTVAARASLGFAMIIGAALLVWRLVERPARRWLLRRQPATWRAHVTAAD